jgi:curved DNA-binding protein CbpA
MGEPEARPTADDFKKSFRLLAKKLHPDANESDPKAAALFAESIAAQDILGDEEKRRAFDRGEIDAEGHPPPEPVATALSGLTLSVTGLTVAVAFLVASPLIMRTEVPPIGINANGVDGGRVLYRVSGNEAGANIAQAKRRQPGIWSHSRHLLPQSVAYENLGITANSDNKITPTGALTNQNATHHPPKSQLDHEQIELLIGLGKMLLSEGDVGAARNLLQRAAEARDARAALALGATYDPIMLAILQAQGVAADLSLARDWYRKASEFGSREARERLNVLTSAKVDGGGTVGLPDVAVELRRADYVMVDRGSLHREWPQKPTVPVVAMHSVENLGVTGNSDNKITPTGALTDRNAIHHPPASQLDHEQIELLIGRGEKLLSEGDVGAARNLLQRAAEARDARAALALGATYDPIMLAILQAQGVAADLSLARDWYRKASEFGSREALDRLNVLTSAKVDGGGTVGLW